MSAWMDAWTVCLLFCALPAQAGLVTLDVDWPSFLATHDLTWRWQWSESAAYHIRPSAADLADCPGDCCLAARGEAVQLAPCNASSEAQLWELQPNGLVLNSASETCLQNLTDGTVALGSCDPNTTVAWAEYEGYWMAMPPSPLKDGPGSAPQCLQLHLAPFCTGTVCPHSMASKFTSNTTLLVDDCQNGDRRQLFAAQSSDGTRNLVPLTWAVSAYVGNGLVGARVQSEPGGLGVLHVLIDNVKLGAGGHREPNGYFRMAVADPAGAPYTVSLRQSVFDSVIAGNVSRPDGSHASSFSLWVNAELELPVVVLSCSGHCGVEWHSTGEADFVWSNRSFTGGVLVLAAVQAPGDTPAAEVVQRAESSDLVALKENHTAWWARYWGASFVTVPVTRVQQYYYAQMHRFPASDRVVLHGLMGAFGPTDNFNLWPDDVWDMNEQVMYWISAASNRPEIGSPLKQWFEGGGRNGGLWMAHNYVKQLRFEGSSDALRDVAWRALVGMLTSSVGANQTAPGALKRLGDGLYHVVGCSSPEYRCYPPFESRSCSPTQDCNYDIAQLRWGLRTVLELTAEFGLQSNLSSVGVDQRWWSSLLDAKLAWYPWDESTGFRLDASCEFACPHRHFSHLLQIYDLETVGQGRAGQPGGNQLVLDSIDTWYRVTCNASNWFNEECRGFTQCGLAAMSSVAARPTAAQGNLTALIDTVITPNGMYGEMVYQSHPNQFSPVSESAYCGAGVLHTMLLHTDPATKVLSLFPGFGSSWGDAGFYRLRASGGLVVSAARRDGSTQFVSIEAATPQVVTISVPEWTGQVSMVGASGCSLRQGVAAGSWELAFKGSGCVEAVLYVGVRPEGFVVAPLAPNVTEQNWFGYNRPMQPLH